MTVVLILAAWWLLLVFVAWALCRVAHDSDEALEVMSTNGGWRNRGES